LAGIEHGAILAKKATAAINADQTALIRVRVAAKDSNDA
jgi:hypothetical protein